MRIIIVVAVAMVLSACSGPSEDEIKAASKACKEFIAENMDVPVENTEVFDSWGKNGAVVLEVGYKKYTSDESYSVRKCVVDSKKGTISSPSPLNDGEWAK